MGHTKGISSIACLGNSFVSGGIDGLVILWTVLDNN